MSYPKNQGLYDSSNERENCGIGLIVDMKGRKSHDIVSGALEICVNLDHRGGCGCDPITGDGAGIFIQKPHKFFAKVLLDDHSITLPNEGDYGVGFFYLFKNSPSNMTMKCLSLRLSLMNFGLNFCSSETSQSKVQFWEKLRQLANRECNSFSSRPHNCDRGLAFERKLYLARRMISYRLRYSSSVLDGEFHASSFSSRTLVYKGMLTTEQLSDYFPDLADPDMESALALTHSRFSTNTFPSWPRAQPFRYLCHNGEINTVRGNEDWLYARQMQLASEVFAEDVEKIFPIIRADGSDSQKFDNCLEFLILSGRSLAHSMMMIP